MMKQIRLSQSSKDKLSRLKSKTGITNWNVLCRWAFCYSLSESVIPADIEIPYDSNLEMSWYTFGGEYVELYEALIKQWCVDNGIDPSEENLSKYFRLHLERGIAHLSGTGFIRSLEDLLKIAGVSV